MASEASPQWGGDWNTSYCLPAHMLYICAYVHNPESQEYTEDFTYSTTKIGNGRLRKHAIDTLDSLMMMKTAADSKAKEKKLGSTRRLLG